MSNWISDQTAITTVAAADELFIADVGSSDVARSCTVTQILGTSTGLVGATAGTVTASLAVIVDASKDASAFRTVGVVNLDAGSSGAAGTVDIFPTTASKGKIALTAADSAGDTTTTLVNASQAGTRAYTIPDAGGNGDFAMVLSNTGATTADHLIHTFDTQETNGTVDIAKLKLDTSGTAAANLGAGIAVWIDNDATQVEERASLDFVQTSAANGAEICDLAVNLMSAGAMAETLRIISDAAGTTSGTRLQFTGNTAELNGVVDALVLKMACSGTEAAGLGLGVSFQVEDAGGMEEQASIDTVLQVVTDASEEVDLVFNTQLAGTIGEVGRFRLGDFRPLRMNEQKYAWAEDFDEEAAAVQFEAGVRADEWVSAGTNYAATNLTYTAGIGGTLQAVTAGADNDSVHILGIKQIPIDSNPIMEARYKITDITNAFMCVGFVEGSFDDKGTYDDDICIVGFDSDNAHTFGADQMLVVCNDNAGGADVDDGGVAITAGTYVTVRIDLTDTEQPRVWINVAGGLITPANEVAAASISGTVQAAITVSPYFMVQSLSGAADTATIDYIKVWYDRG